MIYFLGGLLALPVGVALGYGTMSLLIAIIERKKRR
jgi:hypothetical protein